MLANRPYGVVDPPLQVIASIAFPIISGAYLGVAEAAYAEAVTIAATRADDPCCSAIGLMRHKRRWRSGRSTVRSRSSATIRRPPTTGSSRR